MKIKNKHLKESSKKWLQRHITDPYVKLAKQHGYRSRAAFKILEIQDKYKIFKPNSDVIDLGAAPGSWSQVIAPLCQQIVAIDLLHMEPLDKVTFIQGDFTDERNINTIKNYLNQADVIMCDMAPNTCGIPKVDHLRIINLLEIVIDFSQSVLKNNGALIAKIFQGGLSADLQNKIKKLFKKVENFKPKSSRKDSVELYLIAQNYKRNDL